MCGISGTFNYKTKRSVSFETLKAMTDSIVHRGPDDEGFFMNDYIGLGFRRLSIIDLNTGNQPIHNEDNTVWVVFNGEIYNYVELRKSLEGRQHIFYTTSDTEVILHLYEEHGEDFVHHLNGMFAVALWDDRKKVLILARDRAGIKPLYYAQTTDGLIFASEIKALLKADISRQPDPEAINQYLSYGYIPSPRTGFSAIRKLNAGHILICSTASCSEKEFWDLQYTPSVYEDISEDEMSALLVNDLREVMLRQTRSDVPLGIFLSGGIDSSLIASVASEHCSMKLNAFTIGFEEDSYSELDQVRIITKRLGLPLHEFILTDSHIFQEIDLIMSYLDEPLFDYSAIPVYFVSKFARSRVKTVVGGEGGDELFGGYQTHYLHRISKWYKRIPRVMRNGFRTAVMKLPESHMYLSTPYKLKRFTYGAEFPYDQAHYRWKVIFDSDEKSRLLTSEFFNTISEIEAFCPMNRYFSNARSKGFSILDQLIYVDFKTFLQDDPLQKTDRMSMANSLEVRVPLLDNAIIDFSTRVPQNKKVKGFQTKYLLRKALSRFLPSEIAFGKKRGFTPPVAVWLKNGLKDYMFSCLSPEAIAKVGFLEHRYISRIIDDHLNGKSENSRLIWALIVLVHWHEKYVNSK